MQGSALRGAPMSRFGRPKKDAVYYLLQRDCETELRRYPKVGSASDGGADGDAGSSDGPTDAADGD
jgi:hypothetical protein